MPQTSLISTGHRARGIVQRTHGRTGGPVTRLMSPDDLGQFLKPYVFLDLFAVEPETPTRFALHPHSGIATLTALTSGEMNYKRRDGEPASLTEGGIEWMMAGGGVWHGSSLTAPARAKGFQLWVALPPEFENADSEEVFLTSDQIAAVGPARVLLGEYQRVRSLVNPPFPMTYLHITLKADEAWTFVPPITHDVAWIALDRGCLMVEGEAAPIRASELAAFAYGTDPILIIAKESTSFVLGSARRHPHDLVTGHYSVHTNSAALAQGEARIDELGAELRRTGRLK